jgi:phytoene/squalene synthetase
MELYDEACFECSKLITQAYSTSFSRGIRAFHQRFRYPIYAVYGFVRFADEIVDTFHGQDKLQLLKTFEQDVFAAIEQKISLNPILQSFQMIVNQYAIDLELVRSFLRSMELDIEKKVYTEAGYIEYIHGSAEVIGLMCLRVFCEGDGDLYNELAPSAKSLGSALQKINFLRDIKSDHQERGRIYFPGVCFDSFTDEIKQAVEADIQTDLDAGFKGIKALPAGAKLGVYIAYTYYLQLFRKICKSQARVILQKRMRIPNTQKTLLYYKAVLRHNSGLI